MPRAPIMQEGEWYEINWRWRQICCHCGLSHDWDFKEVDGKLLARLKINNAATTNVRRSKGFRDRVKKWMDALR